MSGEGNKSSFGSSRPQPPTPRQTPTSAVFPASVLQTPKDDRTTFDDPTLSTPRFAEEYSVFNSTPGNLRGGHGHGHFPEFAAHSPYLNSAPKKRPVSIESLAAEVASHANHFTQNQNLPLPPVDPSRRLSSSPAGLLLGSAFTEPLTPTSLAHRSKRRDHRKDLQEAASIQIETPPPSTHKGGRRLAPRLHDEAMQDEQLYAHDFVAGPGHQQNMGSFTLASPTDMFGFPLAPATAPAFTEARSFWDTDMTGMEMDFSMADASMFQAAAAAGHRPGDSMDWGRPSDLFPTQGMMLPQHQDPSKALQQNTKKERTLAPKPLAGNGGELSGLNDSFPINMEDPFALAGPPGGVDPGLLFTRPGSSGMIPATYDPLGQLPLLGDSMLSTDLSQAPFSFEAQGELRRSASSRDVTSKKGERIAGAAPPKALGRPGLSRSVSENRGRKTLARSATLPTLAPANRTMAPPPQQQPPQKSSRPAASNSRAGGRVSPFKHNRRLSSLASIPESASPRTRTEVKFTIDSRGRARAETTTVVVGKGTNSDRPPRASDSSRKNRSPSKSWASGEDDSSSDDEPIIIPSRNSSFMMPDHPRPASSSNGYHTSRRSISESSASSLGIYFNEQREQELAQQDGETSDAETVLNVPDANRAVGDATSELRKMVQTRQKHMSLDTSRSFVAASAHSAGAISPTKFGDASLPTPSSDRDSHVRCVCSSTQSRINGDAYMVQCESCEMYLHGKCINITRQTHPKVYICAFCANTSNMQSQGARDPRLGRSGNCMPRSASSPLAHKSFKSFR